MHATIPIAVAAAALLGIGGTVLVNARMEHPANVADPRVHHVVIQIDRSDPIAMKLALNNAVNLKEYYEQLHQKGEIELVALGPGLGMLRADLSPVQPEITRISQMSGIRFSACANTMAKAAKAEGKKIPLLPEAQVVPTGVGRIVQLEERGYTYLRP